MRQIYVDLNIFHASRHNLTMLDANKSNNNQNAPVQCNSNDENAVCLQKDSTPGRCKLP